MPEKVICYTVSYITFSLQNTQITQQFHTITQIPFYTKPTAQSKVENQHKETLK